MKQLFINAILLCILTGINVSSIFAQAMNDSNINEQELIKQMFEENEAFKEAAIKAYTPGIIIKKDSMTFSNEFIKLLTDNDYRNNFYAEPCSYEKVLEYLKQNEMQKACWNLINLYPENKELALKVLYSYSNIYQIEKIVVYSVYTYGFLSPEIGKIENNKPIVHRPDILEQKLRIAKEIAETIMYYRNIDSEIGK